MPVRLESSDLLGEPRTAGLRQRRLHAVLLHQREQRAPVGDDLSAEPAQKFAELAVAVLPKRAPRQLDAERRTGEMVVQVDREIPGHPQSSMTLRQAATHSRSV